jgi:quaternary ammonium compound-resistance protein SugE
MNAFGGVTAAWLVLLAAGAVEIAFAVSMKFTAGFTRLTPSLVTVGLAAASVLLLSRAVVVLPVGTAYAVWTGIGAAGVATIGMVLFHESRDAARLMSIVLIIAGVIGLRLTGEHGATPRPVGATSGGATAQRGSER